MYLVRTGFAVGPGGAAAFEAGAAKLAEIRKGAPGYAGETLLRSYGSPNKYVINTRWESPEAYWDFSKSDAFVNFVTGNTGVFTVTGQDAYEDVLDVPQRLAGPPSSVPPMCEVLVDWTLKPGAVGAFAQSRQQLFALRQGTAGFASSRLRRSAGNPNKYLVIHVCASLGEAQKAAADPKVQAFGAANPYTNYAVDPPTVEAYQVVGRFLHTGIRQV